MDTSTQKKFDFVYVASGDAHKNHRTLLAAWRILAEEGKCPSLALTVDAKHYPALADQIHSSALPITNLGSLTPLQINALYISASALIFPSHCESFGLPLLEATQHGIPIIASERDYVRDVPVVHDNLSCLQVMALFKEVDTHLALVVDEYGSTEGIVSDSDILEAIIGTMRSNYDEDDHTLIIKRKDGSWLVDGLTSIDEIHLAIGLHEISTDDDFDTIAGFVLHSQKHSPKEGDIIERFGYRFEVIDMDGRRIDKLLITRLDTVGLEE